jgi:hypothetical protein
VNVVRARWTSASFLVYAGALTVLFAASALLGVIEGDHGLGTFAGFSVLFFVVPAALAGALRRSGRHITAGVFAFVAVALFAVMIGAFMSWFGWLDEVDDNPFHGFDVARLALVLLTIVAAVVALRIFRFPLVVLILAGAGWYFVTDLVSGGGNWSAVVTLLFGLALFLAGLPIDSGDTRPYGFWLHVAAGLTVGGALLYFWHSSDTQWALIIVAGLVYIAVGAAIRRSSYAVLGALGLAAATAHFSERTFFPGGDVESFEEPQPWVAPVAYLCLGFFLALVGLLLARRRGADEQT